MTSSNKQAVNELKADLYKLCNLVGRDNKVSSFKVFPGETILVTLYWYGTMQSGDNEIPIGQFPIKDALLYLERQTRHG